MHNKVKRKLFHLYTGELAATIVFAVVWLTYFQQYEWAKITVYTAYAFCLLEFILLQGTYYWYLKYNQMKLSDYAPLPYNKLRIFKRFKVINLVLIGLGIPLLIAQLTVLPATFYFFLFLYLFAIAEYINYYYIRLSYQTSEEIRDWLRHKKLRSSRLARELKAMQNSKAMK